MTNRLTRIGHWCSRTLSRTWFLITESDPPEPPKPGIRIFGRVKPGPTVAEQLPPRRP